MIAGERVLPKLHGRVGRAAGLRIDEADRLHRTEAQRLTAAMRHHFDGQAPLEEFLFVEVVDRGGFRGHERIVKAVVRLFRQRTVQIVTLTIVNATGHTRIWRGSKRPPPA